MLLNYFLLALRNVKKQRGYAVINTLGLAIGLASALLIFLYVRHERTYDTFHPYYDQTYRIGYKLDFKNGQHEAFAASPAGWDNYIKDTYAGVSKITSFISEGMPTSFDFKNGEKIVLS